MIFILILICHYLRKWHVQDQLTIKSERSIDIASLLENPVHNIFTVRIFLNLASDFTLAQPTKIACAKPIYFGSSRCAAK